MSDLGKRTESRATDTPDADQPLNPVPPPTNDPIAEYKVFVDDKPLGRVASLAC